MAKQDKISMPMSTAGLTRYFDDYKAKFEFAPGHVILMVVVVTLIVILLHMYGNAILGIS